MVDEFQLDLSRRPDLRIIYELVPEGGRVFDLGCGSGEFLRMLKAQRHADVLGVEIDQRKIARCIANGVPVIQGDLDDDFGFVRNSEFDLVILSQTLQEVKYPDLLLNRIVRIGRQAAISFINFGHIGCRLQLLLRGRMPQSDHIPYEWYNTPNIHLGTILDFRALCNAQKIRIVREIPIGQQFSFWPNLFASGCVFLIEQR